MDLKINLDRFQCKDRRLEFCNNKIDLSFKHRPSNHKRLYHGVTFNLKSGQTYCPNSFISKFSVHSCLTQ